MELLVISDVILPLYIPASTNGLSGDDESSHHDVLPACDEAAQPLRLRVQCSGERHRAMSASHFSFPVVQTDSGICVRVCNQAKLWITLFDLEFLE